jgi:GAF domain-containing protein
MNEIDYDLLSKQALSLCEGGGDSPAFETACLANVSALIFDALHDVNWAGFYRLMPDGSLLLGPFQGKPACMVLYAGKGVCQAAVSSGESVVVNDVHAFPGHIACDSASASEIVLPLRKDGRVVGVLDIDSPVLARFSEEDEIGLAKIAAVIEKKGDFYEGFFKT